MTEENFNKPFYNADNYFLDEKFCKLFFSDNFSNKKVAEDIGKNIDDQLKLNRSHASYSNVTRYIFYKCDEKITSEFVDTRCEEFADLIDPRDKKKASFVYKTNEDIKLAFAQKEYIGAGLKETKKTLNKVKNNLGRIYAEFITLLGIFTAIAFSAFGGIEALSSIFSKLSFKNPRITMGFVLVIGSIIAIVIYGILFILMESIYKLLNIAYEREEKENIISKSLNKWILIILSVMLIVGSLLIAIIDFSQCAIKIFAIIGFISLLCCIGHGIKKVCTCKRKNS